MVWHVKLLDFGASIRFVTLFFWLCLWGSCSVAHAQDGDPFYIVKQVIVHIPQGGDPTKNTSAIGLLEAQKIAFKYLMQKMLPVEERQGRHLFIKDIQKNIKDLLQRSIIVSERRTSRDIELAVNIHFDKEKIRQLFESAGISFCETAYPATLLLMDEPLLASPMAKPLIHTFEKASNLYGFELIQPLRDVEDLTNLALAEDPSQIQTFKNWARTRYKAERTWKISISESAASEPSSDQSQNWIRLKLVEIGDEGVEYHFSRVTEKKLMEKGKEKEQIGEEEIMVLANRMVTPWIATHIVQPGTRNVLDVAVINSNNLDMLDGLMDKMKSFSGVEKVSFLEMSSNNVKLRLQYKGNEMEIKDQLKGLGAVDNGQGSEMSINLP
ncbi:MAG: DUF2066 domain-containing protein [Magnetococcales bacterium]|nr:DUF2066 domain-containing protein [Magnetococcales bacterium]